MKTNPILLCQLLLASVAAVGAATSAVAVDSSTIRLPLRGSGADPDAKGVVLSTLRSRSSLLIFSAGNLTPGHGYILTVGDRAEAELTANRQGKVSASFGTTPRKNRELLDFDPRGQRIALLDGATVVLEGVASGANEPAGILVNERAKLARLAGTGEATASYQVLPSGRRLFSVKLERVTGSGWALYVNGILRGPINIRGREAVVVFDSAPGTSGRPLLDFDPRGQVVDIAQDGTILFSGKLEAKANNVNVATPSVKLRFIPSTGVDADGTARVELRVDPDARRKLSVEVEDVPAGVYELLVNGEVQGTINVVAGVNGTRGEIEFSTREDDAGELPLTFDPVTAMFAIQSGGVVYFQGGLGMSSVPSDDSSGPPVGGGEFAPDTFAGLTLNLDDQPGGDLMQFSTATTGVDLGVNPDSFSYSLSRMNASQVQVNVTEGDKLDSYVFTFTAARAGTWKRDEYRQGQLKDHDTGRFTIVSGDPTVSTGGTNASSGGISVDAPVSFRESLTATGLDGDASGHADFEITAGGKRKFSVEIEDVAAGSYELWVGGVRHGSIVVSLVGTKTQGEVEFESPTDDAGKLRLGFDPRGQLVEVKAAAGVYFSHLLGFGAGAGTGSGTGSGGGALILPVRTEVPLFNLGELPGASAEARFKLDDRGRRTFEVEIEQAPVGVYALRVGGAVVGSITVATSAGGTRGSIEFEDDDSGGHLQLTFDPVGQLLTISRDGVNHFQRVFPASN